MNLNELIELFNNMNNEAALYGESVVKLTAANADYYDQQLQNLEIDEVSSIEFLNWLKTQ